MKIRFLLFALIGLLAVGNMMAQKGELVGTLNDTEYNDVLPFANVMIKGSDKGTTTDFEGRYTLKLDPGTYTVVFSFIGYETKEITDVIIKADEVYELNTGLGPQSNQLEEVVVTAQTAQNTEASMLNVQKKSVNLLDGMSAQAFKKIGASDLAAAVKNVPGVSVVGGKYVYVRGLGDRYTKSTLNGIDIPGLDPDRNTVQMDLFPTNIIDNTQIIKSSTANLPADFTGGVVNIVTKDFPNKKEFTLGISGTYNPDMHFNSNYLSYKGSSTDVFGFDNGKRALPISREQYIPQPSEKNPLLTVVTEQFNPDMQAQNETSLMDFGINFTMGNQYDVGGDKKIGYMAAASYKNRYVLYEGYQTGVYRKSRDKSENELEVDKKQEGDLGRNDILVSALAGISFKTPKNKYKLTAMHIQNGISTAGYLEQQIVISDAVTLFKDNLEYKQSQISNALISGKHSNEDASWVVEWKVSPTYSRIQDKDVRVTPFEYDEDQDIYFVSPSSSGNPSRIWRGLEEVNGMVKGDATRKHELFQKSAKLLFGASYLYKQRDFSIDNYRIILRNISDGRGFNGQADAILASENIWKVSTDSGSYIQGNFEPANTYDATQSIAAVYASEEFQVTEKLKSIIGLRFEKFDAFYTGQTNTGDIVYDNERILNKADLFPSANFIYALTDEQNLRLSYARTTARPSFKEASITQIFDPLSSTTFIGNIDLQPTYINNFDLRFEKFGEASQMYAISAFYKNFKDPIEYTFYLAAPDQFTPQNLGSASVYGIELELRKNFGFISDKLKTLSISFNTSIIKSQLEIGEAELEARALSLRDGETLETTRELQGQSPYLINVGLNYTKNDLQAGLFYNAQGKTLEVVGTGFVPDVFTLPFHSLDFNLNKSFGEDKSSNVNFKVQNILGSSRESVFQSYKAQDQIFSKFSPGVGFSVGYSYKF